MRPRMKPTSIGTLAATILLLPFAWMGEAAAAPVGRQSCSGVLAHDADGYMLVADPNSKSLWCDAAIGEGESSPLARQVLKTCKIGGRCHIEGSFSGHGIFFWTQISAVTYLGGEDR
jgi:hypothetical protein